MTRKRFREEVEKTADAARKNGWCLKVSRKIPTISIDKGEEESFFFQGDEASELIDQCPPDVDLHDWLLWQAQGW